MDIHLSEEAARYIPSHRPGSGCRSPSEFVEWILRDLRCAETPVAEDHAWLRVQETAAAKVWDNDADARYDSL